MTPCLCSYRPGLRRSGHALVSLRSLAVRAARAVVPPAGRHVPECASASLTAPPLSGRPLGVTPPPRPRRRHQRRRLNHTRCDRSYRSDRLDPVSSTTTTT